MRAAVERNKATARIIFIVSNSNLVWANEILRSDDAAFSGELMHSRVPLNSGVRAVLRLAGETDQALY